MRKSEGFTLVELLAVLVILAIIALITTPIILGVIEDSRESAAVDKTWAYVNAIENAYALTETKGTAVNLPHDGTEINGQVGSADIRVSGDKASAGAYTIKENGQVEITSISFDDGYTCKTNSDSTNVCCNKAATAPESCS